MTDSAMIRSRNKEKTKHPAPRRVFCVHLPKLAKGYYFNPTCQLQERTAKLSCHFALAFPHGSDAALGLAEEGNHLGNDVNAAELFFNLFDRSRDRLPLQEQHGECPTHGVDLPGGQAGAAHADNVDADDTVDPLLHDERRNVLG